MLEAPFKCPCTKCWDGRRRAHYDTMKFLLKTYWEQDSRLLQSSFLQHLHVELYTPTPVLLKLITCIIPKNGHDSTLLSKEFIFMFQYNNFTNLQTSQPSRFWRKIPAFLLLLRHYDFLPNYPAKLTFPLPYIHCSISPWYRYTQYDRNLQLRHSVCIALMYERCTRASHACSACCILICMQYMPTHRDHLCKLS